MEITLEQVERLRDKTGVRYAQAKQALEYSGGNLLDALIYLEEQGTIPRPEEAYYSTRGEGAPTNQEDYAAPQEPQQEHKAGAGKQRLVQRIRYWLLDNELEIWRNEQPIIALPLLVVILLMLVAFRVMIPALVVGLFCGLRYRFSGPDLERDSINSVMDNVASTAADLGRQIVDELRSQQEKNKNTGDDQKR